MRQARLALVVLLIAASGCSAGQEDPVAADVVLSDGSGPVGQAGPIPVGPPRTDLGTIEGHVALLGRPPGNRVIRMGMDPKCASITRDALVIQEEVAASEDGDLANVFVQLDGEFALMAPSPEPVRIEQRGCVYEPRVVGVQVGQPVEILNSDDLPHNLHATSRVGNGFNVGQPQAGLTYRFVPQQPEMMLRLACDLHRWMITYIGIVSHPYFDVSGRDGAFRIDDVPAGTYTIHAWHEVYGDVTDTVEVREDETTMVMLEYSAAE